MPSRVLNFSEFSGKYSSETNEPVDLDGITGAASNFEEGFDDTTYDQPQIGPNRPVAGNYEATPASPGEEGAPAYSSENTEEMNAPSEEETEETGETGETEENEETEETEENEEDDEVDEGNPEAETGANPEKVEEGFSLVKGFAQFINESYSEEFEEEEEYGSNSWEEEEEECPACGEVPLSSEYGMSCGCNM